MNGTRSISSATVAIPGIELAPRRALVTSRPKRCKAREILSFLSFFSFRADFSHFDLFHRERQWPFIGDAREFTRAWRERFIDFILAQCPTSMENLFFGTRIILRPSCATPTETHSRFLEPTMNRATELERRKAKTNSNSLCIVSQASAIDSVRT